LHNQPTKKIKLDTNASLIQKENNNIETLQEYVLADLYRNQEN